MKILKLGSQGDDVVRLQDALREAGFNPGASDGDFGEGTDAALRAFQRSEGLLADGVAGPKTLAALLDHRDMPHPDDLGLFTVGKVARMFPFTPIKNIAANLPGVLDGLRAFSLTTVPMALPRATANAAAPKTAAIASRPTATVHEMLPLCAATSAIRATIRAPAAAA